MKPSLLIEVTRGHDAFQYLESVHKVDAVVCDANGRIVAAFGDPERGVFPRSANKALQALALVESGAADKFGFEPRHLALACSSHNGEKFQTDGAAEMLSATGLDQTCLECGVQLPYHPRDIGELAASGKFATAIHNNCSGKHSGFLAFAAHQGIDPAGYVKFGHKVQREIAGILESVTGAKHGENNYGIDGCSIPTYEIPLQNLATAYAKLATGEGGGDLRNKAMNRLRNACIAHPEMVAGTGRFDTNFMKAMGNRVFTKTGAEGVFTVAIPELGFGAAMKCHDGTTRAAEVACASLVESLLEASELGLSETEHKALKGFTNPELRNWNGIKVGEVRLAQ